MSKKDEEHIERFFQKALSQQHEVPFMESDWRKLEKMLDDQQVKEAVLRKRRVRNTLLSSGGIMIILVATYFLTSDTAPSKVNDLSAEAQPAVGGYTSGRKKEDDKTSTAGLPSQKKHAEGHLPPQAKTTVEPKGDKKAVLRDDTAQANKQKLSEKNNDRIAHKNSVDGNTQQHNRGYELTNPRTTMQDRQTITALASSKEKIDKLQSRPKNTGETPTTLQTPSLASQSNDENQAVLPKNDDQGNVENSRGHEQRMISHGNQTIVQDSSETIATSLPAATDSSVTRIQKTSSSVLAFTPSRWSVSLVLAPDFSSTVLGRYTTPGKAFGVLVNYRFLNRLSFTTGLLRIEKRYEGYGDEYQPPEGYWARRTNGVVPQEIYGSCRVLEIPVTVQYNIVQSERSNFYISAGLSSYIMSSQSYEYAFEDPNPGAATEWSTSEDISYPFKIGHVSVGYQRQISPRFAIGLEPYLKIPFASMGWTNIDLYSTGVFIKAQYQIFKKKKAIVQGNAVNQ